MKLGLGQHARMEQRLVQSPQMIQAMQILQLSGMELEERIDAELLENPFLEREEGGLGLEDGAPGEPDAGQATATESEPQDLRRETDGNEVGAVELRERDQAREELERYEREYEDREYDGLGPRSDPDAGERKLEAMANAPARGRSLAEALLAELALETLDERTAAQLEFLAWSLDSRGYLEDSAADSAAACPVPDTTPEELEAALSLLRSASHPAIGARDLAQCLSLQLEGHDPITDLARRMVAGHLDDLMHNRLPKIAKALGEGLDDVAAAFERIRHLDPSPGAEYGDELAPPIVPEVLVEEVDGVWEVRLGRSRGPGLRLSPQTEEVLGAMERGGEDRNWARKRLESARWLIEALEQRQSTILRIARAVFAHQRPFLEKGPRAQRPLRMQEIADETHVHISTVSRAVAGKYAQTPRGIFPLKAFFTSGTTDSAGAEASQVSVQVKLAELVQSEDPENPFSDDQLAEELERRHGIKIARRTVTKYRKALGIQASSQRRSF